MLLVECALAAIRTTDAHFGARYRRVMRLRGHKKAVVGPDYSDRRDSDRVRRHAVQTLERMGFKGTTEAAA